MRIRRDRRGVIKCNQAQAPAGWLGLPRNKPDGRGFPEIGFGSIRVQASSSRHTPSGTVPASSTGLRRSWRRRRPQEFQAATARVVDCLRGPTSLQGDEVAWQSAHRPWPGSDLDPASASTLHAVYFSFHCRPNQRQKNRSLGCGPCPGPALTQSPPTSICACR